MCKFFKKYFREIGRVCGRGFQEAFESSTKSTLCSFCIGKHNWRLIDAIRGSRSSAIIYSIIETAKANNPKVYEYVEHLLAEILKHEDDTNRNFLDDLLPWSQTYQSNVGNPINMK